MNSTATPQQRSSAGFVIVLYAFAVSSGIAAQIYEVSWTKMLALTFGLVLLGLIVYTMLFGYR